MIRNLLILFFFVITFVTYGQPGDPNEDPDVPIGGIGLLLAAGAAYGAKKAYNVYKKDRNSRQ